MFFSGGAEYLKRKEKEKGRKKEKRKGGKERKELLFSTGIQKLSGTRG
jgi:hypothetical protein